MIILGVDPGAKESGYVMWDGEAVGYFGQVSNIEMLKLIDSPLIPYSHLAIEVIRGYGVVAGDDTFDTCIWIGRFDPALEAILLPRKEIKRHLCGNTTTNDKYVRQALVDRFGGIGTKKAPGPLYGISGHCWSVLAVAVTAWDRLTKKDT